MGKATYSVTMDASAVTITGSKHRSSISSVVRFAWADVNRVLAWKLDLFTVDQICLQFQLTDSYVVDVDEDVAGWTQLIERLPEFLPGCQGHEDWWPAVAFPPFATNETLLYSRADLDPE